MNKSIVSFIREDGVADSLTLMGYGAESEGDKIFNAHKNNPRIISAFHIQHHTGGYDIRQKYIKGQE